MRCLYWVPAFAGMTNLGKVRGEERVREVLSTPPYSSFLQKQEPTIIFIPKEYIIFISLKVPYPSIFEKSAT